MLVIVLWMLLIFCGIIDELNKRSLAGIAVLCGVMWGVERSLVSKWQKVRYRSEGNCGSLTAL